MLVHVTTKIHIFTNTYGHHNRQGADIVLEAPNHDPLIK